MNFANQSNVPRARSRRPWLALVAGFALLLIPAIADAQIRLGPRGPYDPDEKQRPDKPRSEQPQIIKLTVTPAPEPTPALKHSLVPEYDQQTPGNSVPYYYRALVSLLDRHGDVWQPYNENSERWTGPLSEFPKDEVEKFLSRFQSPLGQLRIATHREQTDWDWRMRDLEGTDVIAFLLPEMQESRSLARLLVLKARVEIVEGRLDDAVQTLQMGYKLARDVGKPPTLINNLVGIAIARMMDRTLLDLIDAPNSPNMYWALAALPDPLIEMRPAFEHEMRLPEKVFPWLKDPEMARRTPEEWADLLAGTLRELENLDSGRSSGPELKWRAAATALVAAGYPRAKQELIEWGYDPEELDRMPVGQVVAIHEARVYRHMTHEMAKWTYLPFQQAQKGLDRAEDRLKEEGYFYPPPQGREVLPIVRTLLPAFGQANQWLLRMQTRTAGLRTLEAIRMHAAENGGKLPVSLDEIIVVPVPTNPADGKPFPYRLEGDTAILDIPVKYVTASWRLEITIDPSDRK